MLVHDSGKKLSCFVIKRLEPNDSFKLRYLGTKVMRKFIFLANRGGTS